MASNISKGNSTINNVNSNLAKWMALFSVQYYQWSFAAVLIEKVMPLRKQINNIGPTQPEITCSKLTTETLEQEVNNRNTRTRCEIRSELTIKTPERRRRRSSVIIVNFERIGVVLVTLLLTLNISHTLF